MNSDKEMFISPECHLLVMTDDKHILKGNWNKILHSPKILDDAQAEEMQANIRAMRKEKGFR